MLLLLLLSLLLTVCCCRAGWHADDGTCDGRRCLSQTASTRRRLDGDEKTRLYVSLLISTLQNCLRFYVRILKLLQMYLKTTLNVVAVSSKHYKYVQQPQSGSRYYARIWKLFRVYSLFGQAGPEVLIVSTDPQTVLVMHDQLYRTYVQNGSVSVRSP